MTDAVEGAVTYAYISPATTMDGHPILVGPFATRDEAVQAAGGHDGYRVIEWTPPPGPGNPCTYCGSEFERLQMSDEATRVYDALFPAVLEWREDDDCGMAELMRDIAETAADALRR